jgi:hypothetical protein
MKWNLRHCFIIPTKLTIFAHQFYSPTKENGIVEKYLEERWKLEQKTL